MNSQTRIIVNTLAQNVRSVINIVLSLYSTRIVMDALGQSDYGIYMLVAGVVSLLNFFTNSLTLTTQRHISYCHGAGKKEDAKAYFANSYLLLLLIGIGISAILVGLTSVIFESGWLQVEASRIQEAKVVYLLVVGTVFISLMTAPFRALLISYENIVYISAIEILDGVLKLSAVFLLYLLSGYRLTTYAGIILIVMLFNLLAFMIYCQYKYPESCIYPSWKLWNSEVQKKIIGFATWSLYGMACIVFRTQGISVLINQLVKGTVMNASYGIAIQVQGAVNFFSSSIHNSIKPQIIKSYGAGEHERAVRLSETSCKFGFLILALIVVPIIAELPTILSIWLKEVPPLCVLFCTVILSAALTDQLSLGMTILMSATGRIRNFSLLNFTAKTLTIPAMYFAVKNGLSLAEAFLFYWVFEMLSVIIAIAYICQATKATFASYMRNVFLRIFPVLILVILTAIGIGNVLPPTICRVMLTGISTSVVGIAAIWMLSLVTSERQQVIHTIQSKFTRN